MTVEIRELVIRTVVADNIMDESHDGDGSMPPGEDDESRQMGYTADQVLEILKRLKER